MNQVLWAANVYMPHSLFLGVFDTQEGAVSAIVAKLNGRQYDAEVIDGWNGGVDTFVEFHYGFDILAQAHQVVVNRVEDMEV